MKTLAAAPRTTRLRLVHTAPFSGASVLRQHYASRPHRVELAVTSLALCFGGGAVMFWLHGVYRSEAGPAISHGNHWLLDSSLGFLALTPVLVVLLAVIRVRVAGRPLLRPLLIGAAFTLVTAPGPLLHDALVGGGTALADAAVLLFGEAPGVVADDPVDHSAASKVLLQLAVGLPAYTAMACLAALVCRGLTPTPRRRSVAPLVAGWARG
jgi:hypothetical protein